MSRRQFHEDDWYQGSSFHPESPPHCGFAIASGVIALVVVIIDLLLFGIGVLLGISGAFAQERDSAYRFGFFLGLINFCGAIPSCLTGLILGIVSLNQPERRRGWAVVGVTLNGLILFALAILFLVGLIRRG
jgi:hypothetical protein